MLTSRYLKRFLLAGCVASLTFLFTASAGAQLPALVLDKKSGETSSHENLPSERTRSSAEMLHQSHILESIYIHNLAACEIFKEALDHVKNHEVHKALSSFLADHQTRLRRLKKILQGQDALPSPSLWELKRLILGDALSNRRIATQETAFKALETTEEVLLARYQDAVNQSADPSINQLLWQHLREQDEHYAYIKKLTQDSFLSEEQMRQNDFVETLYRYNLALCEIYEHALPHIHEADKKKRIDEFALDIRDHTRYLQKLLKSARLKQPPARPTLKGKFLEVYAAARSLTGPKGALKALLTAEEVIMAEYRKALVQNLFPKIHHAFSHHLSDEEEHIHYLRGAVE